MGFWASGDENPYPSSSTMQPGSQAWNDAKAREKSFADQMSITEKAKGPKTPGYEASRAAVMDLYEKRKRTAGPADVVAARAGFVAPTGAGSAAQKGATSMLAAASRGEGPSAANAVMGQGKDDAIRARLAAIAGARPTALAQQQATGAAAGAMSQAAASSAATKAGEVQSATGQYGAALGAMRGGDLATASMANKVGLSNATMEQQAALANQKATMDWYAMSDAEKRALLGMGIGLDQNEMTNDLNYFNFTQGITNREQAQSMRDSALRGAQYANAVQGGAAALGYGAQWYGANYGNNSGWGDDDFSKLRRA